MKKKLINYGYFKIILILEVSDKSFFWKKIRFELTLTYK